MDVIAPDEEVLKKLVRGLVEVEELGTDHNLAWEKADLVAPVTRMVYRPETRARPCQSPKGSTKARLVKSKIASKERSSAKVVHNARLQWLSYLCLDWNGTRLRPQTA